VDTVEQTNGGQIAARWQILCGSSSSRAISQIQWRIFRMFKVFS